MVRRDSTGDSNPAAPRHSSLPTLTGGQTSRRDAAMMEPPVPEGQPTELREPWRAVRAEPMHLGKERVRVRQEPVQLRKERARLRGEPWRWQEQGQLRELRATGLRPEQRGLGSGASAAPPPWIAPRSDH
jgi:hypothetical protein